MFSDLNCNRASIPNFSFHENDDSLEEFLPSRDQLILLAKKAPASIMKSNFLIY